MWFKNLQTSTEDTLSSSWRGWSSIAYTTLVNHILRTGKYQRKSRKNLITIQEQGRHSKLSKLSSYQTCKVI